MKFSTTWRSCAAIVALAFATLFIGGCGTLDGSFENTGADASGAPATPKNGGASLSSTVFQVGDLVKIEFSGPPNPIAPHEEHIKEDGTITLDIGPVQAAGKTSGQLQKEIRDLYVPRIYKYLSVTVRGADQFYYVGGQVKQPGRLLYLGPVTVTGAIKAAGDFTDFAKRSKVKLIRAGGQVVIVNCDKAQINPELDLPVYPGDRIDVPQRLF